jgi:D-alanyl-D-alanine carboxypeptidase
MSHALTTVLELARDKVDSPGLAAAVCFADGRSACAACGIADRLTGLPVSSSMAFPAGSIIKPAIGVIALQLAAEGVLGLDEALHQHVPEFIGTGDLRSAPSPATLRQVLNHSAGIKCFTELLYWLPYALQVRNAQQQWGDTDALAIANHFAPYFPPGSDYHYSNCGYALLGLALERAASTAAGRAVSMDELLRRRVFGPAAMLGSRYIRHDPPAPNTQMRPGSACPPLELRGYMAPEHGGHDVTEFETYGLYGPAGALLSTLDDLLRLSRALHAAPEQGGLLSPGQQAELLDSIPAGGQGKRYGLGVQLFERDWAGGRFIGHGGNVMGTSSGMWFFPGRELHLAFVANRALVWERPIFEALLQWADSQD